MKMTSMPETIKFNIVFVFQINCLTISFFLARRWQGEESQEKQEIGLHGAADLGKIQAC